MTALPALKVEAQGVLTLSLETPGFEDRAAQESSSGPQQSTKSSTYTTSVQVQDAKNASIGRLGSVCSAKATIYGRRTTKSKVFSICTKDMPLAIVGEISDWFGVLMIDGSTGWIQKKNVQLLEYELVKARATAARDRSILTSRGGLDRSAGLLAPGVGNDLVQEAFRYMGVPYVWGGTGDNGMDCSGFLQKIHAHNGMRLPRTAREQANVGMPVGYNELQPGDRLYFTCKSSTVDHCGMYIGNDYFIHSSAGRGGVGVDKLSAAYWYRSLAGVRR